MFLSKPALSISFGETGRLAVVRESVSSIRVPVKLTTSHNLAFCPLYLYEPRFASATQGSGKVFGGESVSWLVGCPGDLSLRPPEELGGRTELRSNVTSILPRLEHKG